ncbi:MAG TPA: diguanylate cyclase [Thermoanaerobaculia bacterium]|nr:diguanylate cyclase [Thermoanaerobaculia bacterium]
MHEPAGDDSAAGLYVGDVAARVGGDEFVVLLVGVSAEDAKEVAARIVRAVAEEARALWPNTTGRPAWSRTLPEPSPGHEK